MNQENTTLISGNDLKNAVRKYLTHIQADNGDASSHFLSVFNKWFLRVATQLLSLDPHKSWEESLQEKAAASLPQKQNLEWDFLRLRLFLDRWQQGRFVSYDQRKRSGIHYYPRYGSEFGIDTFLTCQGAPSFMTWREMPLMKTAFDFAIYPQLIADLRPQTIFEIGSGSGASAIWLADLMSALDIPGHVHSVDIVLAQKNHAKVTFYQGDCTSPETLFNKNILKEAPHPWLVIEDAHLNVGSVMDYCHSYLKKGDYLYIEDSEIKSDDIRQFLTKNPDYLVDTKYTDFFGRNATCAIDSIFVRTKD